MEYWTLSFPQAKAFHWTGLYVHRLGDENALCLVCEWVRRTVQQGPSVCSLTCHCQINGWARLVFTVFLINGLDVVLPRIGGGCGQDHKLILQGYGSVGRDEGENQRRGE